MPDESEHKIDSLLKAWAAKRRQEAGQGFELHPATRRLLLDEVARRFPKQTGQATSWWGMLTLSWARLGAVAGLCALLGVLAWTVSDFWTSRSGVGDLAMRRADADRPERPGPRNRPVEEKERLLLATDATTRSELQRAAQAQPARGPKAGGGREELKLKQAVAPVQNGAVAASDRDNLAPIARRSAPASAQPSPARNLETTGKAYAPENTLREGVARPTLAAPSAAGGSVGAITDESNQQNLALPAARPASPAPAGKPLLAGRSVPVVDRAKPAPVVGEPVASATVKAELARQLFKETDTPAPPTASAPTFALRDQATANYQFVRLADGPDSETLARLTLEQERAKRDKDLLTAPARAAGASGFGVLDRFEFRQSDSKVTFVDADGSVYEGVLAAPGGLSADEKRLTNALAAVDRGRATADTGDVPRPTDLRTSGPGLRSYRLVTFQASGTNSTLQEPVAVSGVLRLPELSSGVRFGGPPPTPPAGRAGASENLASRAAPKAAAATAPSASRLGAAPAANEPVGQNLAGAFGNGANGGPATNVVLLQGNLRVGTNAEKPFRAVRLR